jgi:hypothetical protein
MFPQKVLVTIKNEISFVQPLYDPVAAKTVQDPGGQRYVTGIGGNKCLENLPPFCRLTFLKGFFRLFPESGGFVV